MPKLKILYIASEITPFVNTSSVAPFFRKLTQAMQHKVDLRILVPKFGTINVRKHNLHEVVRLSNIEIPVGGGAAHYFRESDLYTRDKASSILYRQ